MSHYCNPHDTPSHDAEWRRVRTRRELGNRRSAPTTSIFNHGNVVLPPALDRLVRLVVVTPDMHRVHHSVVADETNSNFGFNLPWWDRLFGTYGAQPAAGHERMTIGLEQFRDPRRQWLWYMLALPFTGSRGGYPRGWRRGD